MNSRKVVECENGFYNELYEKLEPHMSILNCALSEPNEISNACIKAEEIIVESLKNINEETLKNFKLENVFVHFGFKKENLDKKFEGLQSYKNPYTEILVALENTDSVKKTGAIKIFQGLKRHEIGKTLEAAVRNVICFGAFDEKDINTIRKALGQFYEKR